MMTRKSGSVVAYLAFVHVPVAALTWRDLRARPASQVRGSKVVWQIASGVNTVGSAAYWLFGRKPEIARRRLLSAA